VEAHRLILEGDSRDAEWLLPWDEATLERTASDGQAAFEAEPTVVHRFLNLAELFEEDRIKWATPRGSLTFKKQPAAFAAMRELVESGLASDADFRSELRREPPSGHPARSGHVRRGRRAVLSLLPECILGTRPAAGPLDSVARLADPLDARPPHGNRSDRLDRLLLRRSTLAARASDRASGDRCPTSRLTEALLRTRSATARFRDRALAG
jgi:hypothetical protein